MLATLDWLEWFNDRRHHRELATPADSETPRRPTHVGSTTPEYRISNPNPGQSSGTPSKVVKRFE